MTEEDIEAYNCECPKCGHKWKIPAIEWAILSLATRKAPHCPKCQSGRILYKKEGK